ncbi:MAG: efflux RND transporter periplasmic adaptor subunit [Planctomycetes bacterium]|nr:efflux RND transporter periplasmic adaptor subunit [Planctomycetota bacterium]
MNAISHARALTLGLATATIFAFAGCGSDPQQGQASQEQQQDAAATNRLDVPPEVVNNLGITFATATRGKLGSWRSVPGQLEVPEERRFHLHATARGRVTRVAPRWTRVAAGDVVVRIESPAVSAAQRAIEHAQRTLQLTLAEADAAHARLAECEQQLAAAAEYARSSAARLQELERLASAGNGLTARELIEARKAMTEAGDAKLDVAVTRDQLRALAARAELEADQARLRTDESLAALSVLTGIEPAELTKTSGDSPAWKQVDAIELCAPAPGVIVEQSVAVGEVVADGREVAAVYAFDQLRFRGHVPEGDVGTLAAGQAVRVVLAPPGLAPIETTLAAPMPVADETTRMVHVQADVPNADERLVHGMSATALVRVRQSEFEEVQLPESCVVFDGLEAIVFKRDPGDLNVVVRTPVELGARAAGRIEVLAGVLDGDQVVDAGVRQLKQTGLGKAPEGGHFHADGTWHSDHK